MSLTPQQRAQVLYLYHVEAASIALIAVMTQLSVSAVRRVLHETSRKDVPATGEAAATRPSSKGRIERQFHAVRDQYLRSWVATRQEPPRRRYRREGRHDRT